MDTVLILRELSDRDRALAKAMIAHANPTDADEPPPSAEQRRRWIEALRRTTVTHTCDCTLCGSVELADLEQTNSCADTQSRVVLGAGTKRDDALVLLFIDSDVPSYLETAPLGDEAVQFPSPDERVFITA
ncbi:hypothetical protein [uncultured Tessaracoccus sp.]|uniref:hypothetical protein n=1 Tax=uncultured Tessaracoccus sp. TaxID=905023 RepID=UPI00262E7212|nr:hypothetical protein [uncultured Tessaracoccus sp.]